MTAAKVVKQMIWLKKTTFNFYVRSRLSWHTQKAKVLYVFNKYARWERSRPAFPIYNGCYVIVGVTRRQLCTPSHRAPENLTTKHFVDTACLHVVESYLAVGCPRLWMTLHTPVDNVAHARGQRCTRPWTTHDKGLREGMDKLRNK